MATGRPLFGRFAVPEPGPVLYLALEGDPSALRDRVGCLARGLGVDPGGDELRHLHFAYKPRGIDLASATWAAALVERAEELSAVLVVVDVLRRAADYDENSAREFIALCDQLEPLKKKECSVALLHHFGKLSEINRDRTPAERMAGSGSMFGALDAGLFITGSENGARRLRIHHECRDIAAREPFGVDLLGEGSGENGGFTHHDTCRLASGEPPAETEFKAPPSEITAFVRERGGEARTAEITEQFRISDSTLRKRRPELAQLGITYVKDGRRSRYVARLDNTDPAPAPRDEDREIDREVANPHGSEESLRDLAIPRSDAARGDKMLDLQGFPLTPHPAIPTGSPSSSRGDPKLDDSEEAVA